MEDVNRKFSDKRVDDLKWIKKHYGEQMAQHCRSTFPRILDNQGKLKEILEKWFHPNKSLYSDIKKEGKEDNFKDFIYEQYDLEKIKAETEEKIIETPEELLDRAGYILYKCDTTADVEQFRKYYEKNERLCTFNDIDGRFKRCHVWFAVKKNVDNIKRSDNPKREDEYGTSVISIQFDKSFSHHLKIINRYNHSVTNPDNTFNSNLDNIIHGLTDSFAFYEGMKQSYVHKNFELMNYKLAPNGKYYKYNIEQNGIYYCTDNIIIGSEVKPLPPEQKIVIDEFIIDIVDKKVYLYDPKANESLPSTIGSCKKIHIGTIYNEKGQKEGREIIITKENDKEVTLRINNENSLTYIKDDNITEISDYCRYKKNLKEVNLPNLRKMDWNNFDNCRNLKEVNLPNLEELDFQNFCHCDNLKEVNLPNLESLGKYNFYNCDNLKEVNLPNLESLGGYNFYNCDNLKKVNFPNLRKMGLCNFECCDNLEEFSAPNLEDIDILEFNFNGWDGTNLSKIAFPGLKGKER